MEQSSPSMPEELENWHHRITNEDMLVKGDDVPHFAVVHFGYERGLPAHRSAKRILKWWPGTELNRRRQPFQRCSHPKAICGFCKALRENFCLFFPFILEPSKLVSNLPAEICIKSTWLRVATRLLASYCAIAETARPSYRVATVF